MLFACVRQRHVYSADPFEYWDDPPVSHRVYPHRAAR